jgi:N,N'-diacetyllegionaminate synthase
MINFPQPQLIAEIGWNHMGDLGLASNMIQMASESGASFAKFQTWKVSRLKPGVWDTDGRREIYENAQLSDKDHLFLIDQCNNFNIGFMTSVFSVDDAKYIHSLGCRVVKIPSFESTNHELISYCLDNFYDVILSTGASTLEEVEESCNLSKKDNLTLMHCVSSYPCPIETINLPRISYLKDLGVNVGFSDHTQDIYAAVASLSYGVNFIEKHFTTDNNLPGRDNKFAILPDKLSQLASFIEAFQKSNINHGPDFQESELDSRNNYRGRFNA